jgi:anti-anti-sigma factor
MSAPSTTDPAGAGRVGRQEPSPPSGFTARRIESSIVVITAEGEIDASNARDLAAYAESHAAHSTQLILDLTRLKFFGTAGFTALHTVNVSCCRDGAEWLLVPGHEVSRLLRLADPQGVIPLAATVEVALATLRPTTSPRLNSFSTAS